MPDSRQRPCRSNCCSRCLRVLRSKKMKICIRCGHLFWRKANPPPERSIKRVGIEFDERICSDSDVIDEIMGLSRIDLGAYRHLYRLFAGKVQSSGSQDNFDETIKKGDGRCWYRFAVAMDELHRMQMWSVDLKLKEHYYLTALAAQFVIVCRRPRAQGKADSHPSHT